MNPSGFRIEEKKSADVSLHSEEVSVSMTSYKSTQSSRSSVLQRAREYNRRIDEQNRRRAKSLERSSDAGSVLSVGARRSVSVGRAPSTARTSTRERAMASVRRESTSSRMSETSLPSQRPSPVQQQQQQTSRRPSVSPAAPVRTSSHSHQQQHNAVVSAPPSARSPMASLETRPSKSRPSDQYHPQQQQHHQPPPPQQQPEAVVTPELLVDALSGHEDGLLAIAERLMEHYDGGYDVMGEAIIDAFADVQKLFQHVVEAAHMEGAAFEASRREDEMKDWKRQVATGELPAVEDTPMLGNAPSPNGPSRLDEFVDQDVKDVLTEAIRKAAPLREAGKHRECFDVYERACQNASSLLPVDSDHRGRLQLSLARAESMSADRACAILRYSMDDVLRSGMRVTRTPIPDAGKRAEVVLNRPNHPLVGTGLTAGHTGALQSADEALNSLIEEMKDILSAPMYIDTPLYAVAKRFWVALHDTQKLQQKNEEKLEQHLGKLKGEFLLAKSEWEEKLSQANEKAELYKGRYDQLKDTTRGENYMEQARHFASRLQDSDIDISNMYSTSRSGGASGRASSVASLGTGLAQQAKTIVNSINNINCATLNERAGQAMQEMQGDMPFERSWPTPNTQRTPADVPSKGRSRTPISSRTTQQQQSSSKAFREYSKSPQRVDV